METKLPAEFLAAFCPLPTAQITETHWKGLGRAGGREGVWIGQTEESWAGSSAGLKAQGGFQVNFLLLKVSTRKTVCSRRRTVY